MTEPADDPLIIQVDDVIEVVMLPGHAMAYQHWLSQNNMHLFPIAWTEETSGEAHIPAYGVGVRFLDEDAAPTDRRER